METIEFTEQDFTRFIEAPVGDYQPTRVACKQCGYFDGPMHKLIHCAKCGGEFVSVAKWTLFNLLQRSAKPHCNEENWLWGLAAKFISNKYGIEIKDAMKWTATNDQILKNYYRAYLKKIQTPK